MAAAAPPPPGIYVPVPTFFKAPTPTTKTETQHRPTAHSYSSTLTPPPDLETQVAHSVYLAKAGIRGLTVLGSTGEAVHLSNAERKSILTAVRDGLAEAGFPDYPLIAGTTSNCIDEVVQQIADAKECGAQWGLVLAPGYFSGSASASGMVAWFTAVAERSILPIMIYHYPGVSNNCKVPARVYHQLSSHPNIVGCKLSHGDVSLHAQIALHPYTQDNPLSFGVFTGLGQHLLPVMSVGCIGAIDGSAGFFPRTLVRLWTLAAKQEGLPSCFETHEKVRRGSIGLWEGAAPGLSKDERKELRDLQYRVSAMEEIVVTHGVPGIKEAIARLRLFGDIDGTRLPLMGGVGDGEWAKWGDVIGAVEEVESKLEKEAVAEAEAPPAVAEEAVASEDEAALVVEEESAEAPAVVAETPVVETRAVEPTAEEAPAPSGEEAKAAESETATTEPDYGVPVDGVVENKSVLVVEESMKEDEAATESEASPTPESESADVVKVEEPVAAEELAKAQEMAPAKTEEVPAVEEPANVEEPTVEETKAEEHKVEEVKVEETKTETPAVEETKPEETKVEEAAVEASKVEEAAKIEEAKKEETAKIEEVKVEELAVEAPRVDEPKAEEVNVEEPKVEKVKVEEPVVEAPKVEAPKVKEPKVEEPVVEAPKVEEVKTEAPAVAEEPKAEQSEEESSYTTAPATAKTEVAQPKEAEATPKTVEVPVVAEVTAAAVPTTATKEVTEAGGVAI